MPGGELSSTGRSQNPGQSWEPGGARFLPNRPWARAIFLPVQHTLQAADYHYVSSPESKWLIGIKKAEFTRGIPPLCFRGRQAPVCGSVRRGGGWALKIYWVSHGSATQKVSPLGPDRQHAAAGLPLRALLVDLPPLPVETPRQLHYPTVSTRG